MLSGGAAGDFENYTGREERRRKGFKAFSQLRVT